MEDAWQLRFLLLCSSSGFNVAERDERDKLISGPTNFSIIGAQLSQCDCEHKDGDIWELRGVMKEAEFLGGRRADGWRENTTEGRGLQKLLVSELQSGRTFSQIDPLQDENPGT